MNFNTNWHLLFKRGTHKKLINSLVLDSISKTDMGLINRTFGNRTQPNFNRSFISIRFGNLTQYPTLEVRLGSVTERSTDKLSWEFKTGLSWFPSYMWPWNITTKRVTRREALCGKNFILLHSTSLSTYKTLTANRDLRYWNTQSIWSYLHLSNFLEQKSKIVSYIIIVIISTD